MRIYLYCMFICTLVDELSSTCQIFNSDSVATSRLCVDFI